MTVQGTDLLGQQLTATGTRTAAGVVLVDTTTPAYDPATGKGATYTYTMGDRTSDDAKLPGTLYMETGGGTTISDPDAIAAHTWARVVLDYYGGLGRLSWDDEGASLVSSVNYGNGLNFCNAFFNDQEMVYGNPCLSKGKQVTVTMTDLDTAAHEVTHGVTGSSADLIYEGQTGALNESFSDYFGNVIGNRFSGSDTAQYSEDGCRGLPAPNPYCTRDPSGGLSGRYLLNGTTYDDYLGLVGTGFRLRKINQDYAQDNGGVHFNSAIWNNALWSVRTRLAQIDGKSGNDSKLAGDFDKVVYYALTKLVTPTSSFLDASKAVEQAIVKAQADPVVLRVAREVFNQSLICPGCVESPTTGTAVATTSEHEQQPITAGPATAWMVTDSSGLGQASVTTGTGGTPRRLGTSGQTIDIAFAGTDLLTLESTGRIVLHTDGAAKVIGAADIDTVKVGLAGSETGAVWLDSGTDKVKHVSATGVVTDVAVQVPSRLTSLGAGSGVVAVGTSKGQVLVGPPGGPIAQVGTMTGAVVALAVYGDRVIAVDDRYHAVLFEKGSKVALSSRALPFGAAVNGTYAVWTEVSGLLTGKISEAVGANYPQYDTDLHLYSSGTQKIYAPVAGRGQQAFPSLSGNRLVWQDAVLGGDDLFTLAIPSGW